ncbi:MAG: hypothetical protein KDE04_22885, partial [Anaerolineales bacterium]|nr:hypothetical protein [Anaerolineales bacterium]
TPGDIQAGLKQRLLRVEHLPEHLGWRSEPLSQHLRQRRAAAEGQPAGTAGDPWWVTAAAQATPCAESASVQFSSDEPDQLPSWVKHYPDIGLAMLREAKTAPGRLWLMLRYLDQAGQGVFCLNEISQTLTNKTSPYRLCGKRQLRNLIRDGNGLFWARDKTHLWLRSAAKVAFALGVGRVTNRPVALPVAALTEGIGAFRAHLYAAFHSGRTKETPAGSQAMPIARDTLARLSGVSRSGQRIYEVGASITTRINYAIGETYSKEAYRERAWEKGNAVFVLQDYRGRQGRAGQRYIAWQLPNSYVGAHPQRPKGRQRRINRELKDLVTKGMPGNVERSGKFRAVGQRYFAEVKKAVRRLANEPGNERYWPSGSRGFQLSWWYCLG